MKEFDFKGIKVSVTNDPYEWVKFMDVPEGAILDETQLPKSTGFAEIECKKIYLFISENCSFKDLLSTVAHELGHIIEGGYKKNPPNKDRYDSKHEAKAEHYENFVMDAYDLTMILFYS